MGAAPSGGLSGRAGNGGAPGAEGRFGFGGAGGRHRLGCDGLHHAAGPGRRYAAVHAAGISKDTPCLYEAVEASGGGGTGTAR